MIKLCFIVPTPHILDMAEFSDIHLLLAHQALKDPEYVKAYKALRDKGHYLIMDNSTFELGESISSEKLIEAAFLVQANEIVAPEVIGNISRTIDKVGTFLSSNKSDLKEFKVGAVVQGESWNAFLRCFHHFLLNPHIDTIYIPMLDPEDSPYKDIPSYSLRILLNRIRFIEDVSKMFKIEKPVHLLGLTDGAELLVQRRYSFIRSNDSSSAFISGFFGHYYSSKGLPVEKIPVKMDFTWTLKKYQKDIVFHNIRMLKSFVEEEKDGYFPEKSV